MTAENVADGITQKIRCRGRKFEIPRKK